MKDKTIRIISPTVTAIVAILDAAVLGYGIFAVVKLVQQFSTMSIIFAVIEVFALVVAILVSKEVLSNGVVFRDDEAEFTGVDDNNIITYDEIAEIDTKKSPFVIWAEGLADAGFGPAVQANTLVAIEME